MEPLRFRDVFPLVPFHYGWSGWIVDRALFHECGGIALHMRRSADTEWLWRVLSQGFAVARIRQPLYYYYSSFTRRSAESRARTSRTWCEVLTPLVEEYADRAVKPPALMSQTEGAASLARFHEMVAWSLWELGEGGLAREHLAKAAKVDRVGGGKGLRRRLAASSPALYHALWRLRRWGARGGQAQ